MADKAAKTCSIDGCGNKSRLRGWCQKHYHRWRNHGDPTALVKSEKGSALRWISEVALQSYI